jgi:RNA polymerase sigma factor (sigma-70 family)
LKVLSIHGRSDFELIAAMQRSEPWALKELFTSNYDGFFRWAKKNFSIAEDTIQDVYQDCVIITYENIQQGKLNSLSCSLTTYLFAVAKNLVREQYRKSVKISMEEELILKEYYHSNQHDTIPEELLQAAQHELLKMEEPCKSILTMFYYLNASIEDIADKLGYKDKTGVKTQKSRCLKYLRDTIAYTW